MCGGGYKRTGVHVQYVKLLGKVDKYLFSLWVLVGSIYGLTYLYGRQFIKFNRFTNIPKKAQPNGIHMQTDEKGSRGLSQRVLSIELSVSLNCISNKIK